MLRSLGIAMLICVAAGSAHAQLAAIELEQERDRVQREISVAEKLEATYEGGAIKSLIGVRIEVLRLSLALIEQRRIGGATASKVETVIPASKPDLEQAANIEREIKIAEGKLAASQQEAQKAAGLIRAVLDSKVAAEQLTVAMLQVELLKARFGIAWLPTNRVAGATGNSQAALGHSPGQQPSRGEQEVARSAQLLVPSVTNKRFRASDWRNGIHEDGLFFDVAWSTAALPKATRAIKGAMVFADLFGEVKMRIGWTINEPLTPGKGRQENGVGIKFNKFVEREVWLKETDLKDMRIWFEAREIIFADGSRESLQ